MFLLIPISWRHSIGLRVTNPSPHWSPCLSPHRFAPHSAVLGWTQRAISLCTSLLEDQWPLLDPTKDKGVPGRSLWTRVPRWCTHGHSLQGSCPECVSEGRIELCVSGTLDSILPLSSSLPQDGFSLVSDEFALFIFGARQLFFFCFNTLPPFFLSLNSHTWSQVNQFQIFLYLPATVVISTLTTE